MKTKHLPGLPFALISLAAVILVGCATPKPAANSVTTNATTNIATTNATAVVMAPT